MGFLLAALDRFVAQNLLHGLGSLLLVDLGDECAVLEVSALLFKIEGLLLLDD